MPAGLDVDADKTPVSTHRNIHPMHDPLADDDLDGHLVSVLISRTLDTPVPRITAPDPFIEPAEQGVEDVRQDRALARLYLRCDRHARNEAEITRYIAKLGGSYLETTRSQNRAG